MQSIESSRRLLHSEQFLSAKGSLMINPASRRVAALFGVAVLAATACSSSHHSSLASPPPTSGPTTTMTGGMALPPGAENMKGAITSPADGTKVTDNTVALAVTTSGYTDTCDL